MREAITDFALTRGEFFSPLFFAPDFQNGYETISKRSV